MKWSRLTKIGLVIAVAALLGTTMLTPSLSVLAPSSQTIIETETKDTGGGMTLFNKETALTSLSENLDGPAEGYRLDSIYVNEDEVGTTGLTNPQNDMGYNTDAGDNAPRALPLYPGEIADGAPGRGQTGTLDPDDGDDYDSGSR
jgi:hypothetical protein